MPTKTAPAVTKTPATTTPSGFDAQVTRSMAIAMTRTPAAIEKDIARLRKQQEDAVQNVNGLISPAMRKGKIGTPEQLVTSSVGATQVRKLRQKYDAAAAKIRDLEIELAQSVSLRR